jgi:hypothetical protein
MENVMMDTANVSLGSQVMAASSSNVLKIVLTMVYALMGNACAIKISREWIVR